MALGDEDLAVDGDPVRLAQVFTNLFNNAPKYTPSGVRIDVSMERSGATGVVRVRDTGMGIPAGMLSRIFELFTQVDRSVGRAHRGIGVGLALARRLLDMHGGAVVRNSDARDIVDGPRDFAARRVLVVDDDSAVANSLVMLLENLGVDVRAANGGAEALIIIGEFAPDLIFLDIDMPGMDGYETARKIRKLPGCKDLVPAALSGWGRAEDRRKGVEAGFDHHFVKPIDLAVLQRLLGAPRQNKMRL